MKRGRPPGTHGTCSHCGQAGHYATGPRGTCSSVYLAAKLVIDTEISFSEAARAFGIKRNAVAERVRLERSAKS